MSIIGLVDTDNGSNKDLETTLGLYSIATSGAPPTFSSTTIRGALAVVPAELPMNPTTGTLAIDISAGNMLKWWDGDVWRSAAAAISGGGGSGIGSGQTIALQQGLDEDFTIAVSGVLVSMTVVNNDLPNGLTLNEATGRITGVPTVFGTYYVELEATFDDATVGTGTVELVIAEAFAVTFTFDASSLANIPIGEYHQFNLTYTPDPNALPITWSVQGLPDGMYMSYYSGTPGYQLHVIAGDPQTAGTYSVTVEATNWVGTTTQNFDITVSEYNLAVYGTNSYDGTYVAVSDGYYTSSDGGSTISEQLYGQPSMWSYPVRIYENTNNSNLKIFFYDPYASWIITDTEYGVSVSPSLYTRPMGASYESSALPPRYGWYGPSSMYIDWIAP